MDKEIRDARVLNCLELRSCIPSCWITCERWWSITHGFSLPRHLSRLCGFQMRSRRECDRKFPFETSFSKTRLGFVFGTYSLSHLAWRVNCAECFFIYRMPHRRGYRGTKRASVAIKKLPSLPIGVIYFRCMKTGLCSFRRCQMTGAIFGLCWPKDVTLWLSNRQQWYALGIVRWNRLHCSKSFCSFDLYRLLCMFVLCFHLSLDEMTLDVRTSQFGNNREW